MVQLGFSTKNIPFRFGFAGNSRFINADGFLKIAEKHLLTRHKFCGFYVCNSIDSGLA